MFLHLGGDVIISKKDIVGMFDLKKTTINRSTKEFLELADSQGKTIYINDSPKSFIATKNKVYFSPISSTTLLKRANLKNTMDDYIP
jgi:hypothetical protein